MIAADGARPARRELLDFLTTVRAAYPDWDERRLIANLRRAVPAYSRGVWTAAMPLNSGPSDLPPALRERAVDLLRRDTAENGVDLGHVLVCLDLRLNLNLIDDAFASWAGDLGLHALTNYLEGTTTPIARPNTADDACLSDLLGDIDGENLARRVPPGRELEAMFDYYTPQPGRPPGPTAQTRFETFLRDLDLLDESGRLRPDAASPDGVLYRRVARYVFWEELKNRLRELRPERMGALLADRDLRDAPELQREIQRTVEQFVAFLSEGLARERAAGTPPANADETAPAA